MQWSLQPYACLGDVHARGLRLDEARHTQVLPDRARRDRRGAAQPRLPGGVAWTPKRVQLGWTPKRVGWTPEREPSLLASLSRSRRAQLASRGVQNLGSYCRRTLLARSTDVLSIYLWSSQQRARTL